MKNIRRSWKQVNFNVIKTSGFSAGVQQVEKQYTIYSYTKYSLLEEFVQLLPPIRALSNLKGKKNFKITISQSQRSKSFTIYLRPFNRDTVEPVLSGTLLSGHSFLSSRLSKSRTFFPVVTMISTSTKRSPLLEGRSHLWLSPNSLFVLYSTCIERSLKAKPLKYY